MVPDAAPSRDRMWLWTEVLLRRGAELQAAHPDEPFGFLGDCARDLGAYLMAPEMVRRCVVCGDVLPPPAKHGPPRRYCPRPKRCRDRAAAGNIRRCKPGNPGAASRTAGNIERLRED